MDDVYHAALCSFFNLSLDTFLQYRGALPGDLWLALQDRYRWTREQRDLQQSQFHSEFKSVMPQDVIFWGHEDYPKGFERLHTPPLFLHYHGQRRILQQQNVAVIGSRNMAPVFSQWMDHEFGLFIRHFSGAVISGGAWGVDQQASRVALRHHHDTLIVVPSGLNALYPTLLKSWWSDPKVSFLTEYLPDQCMRKHHFLKRNRLVAALTNHLLVVQCAEKSGTMITVKHALDVATQVATLPDFPGHYESSGNIKLLKEGAFFIANHRDLVDFVSST